MANKTKTVKERLLEEAPSRTIDTSKCLSSGLDLLNLASSGTPDWADVLGYHGCYRVSITGVIVSMDRIVERAGKQGPMHIRARIIGQTRKTLYPMVGLNLDNKRSVCYVHRIVWEAFRGAIPLGLEVNHIDGKPFNSNLVNLELVTKSGNQVHAIRIGLRPKHLVPLSDEIIRAIREDYANAPRYASGTVKYGEIAVIANKYGIPKDLAFDIGSGAARGYVV